MTKDEAEAWAKRIIEDGTWPIRKAYLDKHGAGAIAVKHWNDGLFTLGVEYGILIAIEKIFNGLEESIE